MDVKALQSRIEGTATVATDPGYEDLRRGLIWNKFTPARYPAVVVQVASENDVVEAIRFARTHDLKIAVRGGGHSWVGFSLRDRSLLIDLGGLKRAQINPEARTATIQPAINGRDLTRELAAHGLAFPVGHCPSVPMSGFLLSGGLGWNSNAWGPACFSVEAARVVMADGTVLVADENQNADLLWAIRGGGPGFSAVVTEYRLKLYPAPRAITTSSYYYPLPRIEALGAWTASIARQFPKEVELTIFVAAAPPALAERCASSNGFVAILSATAFLDTTWEAVETLALLEGGPLTGECLQKEINQPTPIAVLHELGAMLWPERHRYLADTLWSNSPPAQLLATARDHFLRAPSPKSLAVCVLATGPESAATLPDAAFSMAARTAFLGYAVWEHMEHDAANRAWHREMFAALDPFAVGHYVGESDIVSKPARAERSFAPANWQRLNSLRQKYDPDGLFHGLFNAERP
jgi:FAD/FMN-containing dehydrogenase